MEDIKDTFHGIKLPQLPFWTREMFSFGNQTEIDLEVVSSDKSFVTFQVSGMTRSAPFSFDITPDGVGDAQTSILRMNDVPVSVSVHSGVGNHQTGDLYVQVFLRMNQVRVMKLLSGPVNSIIGSTWPTVNQPDPHTGVKFMRELASAGAAAGVELSFTVGAGEIWEVISVQVILDTDATGANRRPHLLISQSGADDDMRTFGAVDITANEIINLYFSNYGSLVGNDNNSIHLAPLPPNIWLQEGAQITTVTTNLQAGDDYGTSKVFGYRYLAPIG